MTEEDKKEIGVILGQVLATQGGCPNGIDAETAATLKAFAKSIQSGQKTAVKAFVTLAIGAICAALAAGVKELLNR